MTFNKQYVNLSDVDVETGFKPVSTNPTKFKNKYRIKSTRLDGYDYSQNGAYFVTICTKDRKHLFGEIINGELTETQQAHICIECWHDLPNHYFNCVLDEFIIMPNHVHGIIFIENSLTTPVETGFKPVPTKTYSLSEIIRGFKTFTARKINDFQKTPSLPFWQTRFYDRIIRNEKELANTRQYIIDNPKNWEKDELYL